MAVAAPRAGMIYSGNPTTAAVFRVPSPTRNEGGAPTVRHVVVLVREWRRVCVPAAGAVFDRFATSRNYIWDSEG